MRWESLFADLEARLAAEAAAAEEADRADLVRAEYATLTLRERLLAHEGSPLRWEDVDGGVLVGPVREVGADWVLVDEGRVGVVLPLTAVAAVVGLSRLARPAGERAGLALGTVLRGLARDRAEVRLRLRGGREVSGTIDRVGRDHLDVAEHAPGEPRRAGGVSAVRTIPTTALVRVAAHG